MTKWQVAVLALVVLAAGALGVKAAVDAKRPRGTDVEQIRRMLFEGESAAERGDAATIHRFISPDYEDELGMRDTQLKYQVSRYLRERRGLEITIPSQSVQIAVAPDGRTATCSFQVNATASSGAANSVPLNLSLARERVFYYWIFPGEEWKVTRASGYPAMDF